MNSKLDLVFKAIVVILLAVSVWTYTQNRNVGRYAYYREGDLEFVLDTATGVIYQGGYAMNHLTGQEGPVPGSVQAPGLGKNIPK